MKNIFYGIASYHRLECKTLSTLTKLGIPSNRIVVSLNDEQDYKEYSRRYGKTVKVIYRPGNCVANNRNNLLEHFPAGAHVVILDDDIRGFKKYRANGEPLGKLWPIETGAELEKMIAESFEVAELEGIPFFGFYSSENLHMLLTGNFKDGVYSKDRIYQGGFCGFVIDDNWRYNNSYRVLDDYEILMRLWAKGGHTFRRNDCVAVKPKMASCKGGYYDLYQRGIQKKFMIKLLQDYPGAFTVKKDFSGLILKPAFRNKINRRPKK